jgi:hypothetical protein
MSSNTWQFLSQIKISSPGMKLIYHYHVPKTGGTSIFANLLKSPIWIPFNTDQDPGIIAGKVHHESNPHGSSKTLRLFGRSHNNAKTLARLQAHLVYDYAFSFYRDPLSIHLSNMNMIVDRVIGLQSGRISLDSEVGRWTSNWIGNLSLSGNAQPHEIAEKLAGSQEYLDQYASILSKYFPILGSELGAWLHSLKVIILDMRILDDFQSSVFKIDLPDKSNQSKTELVKPDMMTTSFIRQLVGDDLGVGDSLQPFLVDRIDDERLSGLISFANS